MKRLYRSQDNRVLFGVCSGLGEYFDLDPVLVRLVWILLTLIGGMGLVVYLVAWIIIPVNAEAQTEQSVVRDATSIRGHFWWGITLVMLGVFLWGSGYRMPHLPMPYLFNASFLLPIVLVVVGIYILFTFARPQRGQPAVLYRSVSDKKIAGVCGGIAEYFNVDPTLVRVIWVAGFFFYGAALLLYLVLAVALPDQTDPVAPKEK